MNKVCRDFRQSSCFARGSEVVANFFVYLWPFFRYVLARVEFCKKIEKVVDSAVPGDRKRPDIL